MDTTDGNIICLCPYCGGNARGRIMEKTVDAKCSEKGCGKKFSGSKSVYNDMIAAFPDKFACSSCGRSIEGPDFCPLCGHKLA